jgi:hypothetical protein
MMLASDISISFGQAIYQISVQQIAYEHNRGFTQICRKYYTIIRIFTYPKFIPISQIGQGVMKSRAEGAAGNFEK